MKISLKDDSKIIEELNESEATKINVSEKAIIEKYDDGQARIIVQRNDFLIPNILQMVKDKDILNLTPSYQRRKRWDVEKKSHLIESLLMNIPIPPIFLYECDLAKYEVMDGQQRLDTIRGYFNNEFVLQNLTKWPELNKFKYCDLPTRIQAGLNRRGLAAVIILTESGQKQEQVLDIRQYVFERLNTGGEKLNGQEIRNCIYASFFNDALIALSRTEVFTKIWNIPPKESAEPHKTSQYLANNKLYSTMSDCEIVLRYFALSEIDHFKGGMKKSLDDCMRRNKFLKQGECDQLKDEYIKVLSIALKIFGNTLFRLPNKRGELSGRHSVPLSDSILIGIKNNLHRSNKLIQQKKYILHRINRLLTRPDTYQILVGRANTKKAIEDRIKMINDIFYLASKTKVASDENDSE